MVGRVILNGQPKREHRRCVWRLVRPANRGVWLCDQDHRLTAFLRERRGGGIAVASQDRRRKDVMEKQHKLREQAARAKRAHAVVTLAAQAEELDTGGTDESLAVGAHMDEPLEGPVVDVDADVAGGTDRCRGWRDWWAVAIRGGACCAAAWCM